MYTLKSFLFFFILSAAALSSFAQNKQTEKNLDEFFSKQFKQSDPGCVVLVAKKGQIIYNKAFGTADLQLNVPMKPEMVFNIASVTKQFTAVAILKLVEENKLSLGDSIQRFVPDYPSKGHTITIEHLLTHTSGIKDYLQIDFGGVNMERWDFAPKSLIDSFKNQPLLFDPGTKYAYSNSGYYLLGYIIEKITGKRYQNYMRDHILKPLGMAHSYFDENGIVIPGRVPGYRQTEHGYKNADFWSPSIMYSTGGLIMNTEDLFKWHQGLYSYRILKKETLDKAFIPYTLKDGTSAGYGYGWFMKTSNDIKSIEHGGALPGYLTNEVYFPAEDIFIAIFTNNGSVRMFEVATNVSAVILGKAVQPDVKVDPKILDKYVGTYRLSIDTNRTFTMAKENDRLIAKSGNITLPVIFQTETKFQFKNLLGVYGEFITENGKTTKFTIEQNGHFEWIKIQ